jgi:hypothetical protein
MDLQQEDYFIWNKHVVELCNTAVILDRQFLLIHNKFIAAINDLIMVVVVVILQIAQPTLPNILLLFGT